MRWIIVKRKDLERFFVIADIYWTSYGEMSDEENEFLDKFIEKYKLEE